MGKKELSYKGSLSRAQALEHLGNLITNLQTGRLRLSSGTESVELDFGAAGQVGFSLEAKAKEEKQQLSLKLSWQLPHEMTDQAGGLSLEPLPAPAEPESDGEPQPAEEAEAKAEPEVVAPADAKPKAGEELKPQPKPKAKIKAAPSKGKAAKTAPKGRAKTK